jgi:hypothetical protein
MARTFARVSVTKQRKARTAAKAARLDEAGLGGRRTGRESAATRRAQARRDAPAPARPAARAPEKVPARPAPPERPRPRSSAARKAAKAARARAARLAPPKKDAGATMTILINGARAAGRGGAQFDARTRTAVRAALSRFARRLTRVEIHFADESGPTKTIGNDKRCRIEARPRSRQPISVRADAPTAEQALAAALGKAQRLLTTRLAPRKRARGAA